MKTTDSLPGYAIRRDGRDLIFTIGHTAHRAFMWRMLNCWLFGTSHMNPVEKFTEEGPYLLFPLGSFDFRFSVKDWNRSVLPHLRAHSIPAMPDGGFQGEGFPTHAQELVGPWQPIADILCFTTIYKHDRACDMVDLLEFGGALMGQLDNRRLFPSGNCELVAEQIVGALAHRHKNAETIVSPAGPAQRQLLWLVQEHQERYRSPLCWAESVFGMSISLTKQSGSERQNFLWTDTPLSANLQAPLSAEVVKLILEQLKDILDDWNENKNGQLERFDRITPEQQRSLKYFFAAEAVRLPYRCIGDPRSQGSSRFEIKMTSKASSIGQNRL